MTVDEFAAQVITDYPELKRCYIAIMPVDGQYDLEVEVSGDTIGGVYRTEETDLTKARQLADELDTALEKRGVATARSRELWQDFLDHQDT